jgi:hypothetical protein
VVWKEFPCPCEAFEGAWPNGEPRALALRQLGWVEWIEVGRAAGQGVPLEIEGAGGAMDATTWAWFRRIVEKALLAVRVVEGGVARWEPCRALADGPAPAAGGPPWSVSMDELDQAGIIGSAALAVIAAAQRGGPFCGHYRWGIPEAARGPGGDASSDGLELGDEAPPAGVESGPG